MRKQAALGQPSYLYLLDHGYPAADDAGLHAFHASELPYVFGTLRPHAAALAEESRTRRTKTRSADAMGDYWTSFARTGRPQAQQRARLAGLRHDARYMHFAATPTPGARI